MITIIVIVTSDKETHGAHICKVMDTNIENFLYPCDYFLRNTGSLRTAPCY